MTHLARDMTEALRELARGAEARAAELDAQRRLPRDLADALIDTGVFRSWVARKYGGLESHPLALYEAIEQVSYFEASMGWVVMVCGTSARLSGLLPVRFAEEIFGDPRAVAGGFVGAMGPHERSPEA